MERGGGEGGWRGGVERGVERGGGEGGWRGGGVERGGGEGGGWRGGVERGGGGGGVERGRWGAVDECYVKFEGCTIQRYEALQGGGGVSFSGKKLYVTLDHLKF